MERKGNEIKKVVMTGGSGPIGLALIPEIIRGTCGSFFVSEGTFFSLRFCTGA